LGLFTPLVSVFPQVIDDTMQLCNQGIGCGIRRCMARQCLGGLLRLQRVEISGALGNITDDAMVA
jgi:hypothetical protein